MKETVRQALAEARRRLEELYGDRLMRVVLYGSQAKGNARAESDVDVLVVLLGPVNVSAELKKLVPIELDLLRTFDENFSIQPFALEDYEDNGRPLMMNVRSEGVDV